MLHVSRFLKTIYLFIFAIFQYIHYEELVKEGCDVSVLPDSIDWCDETLNKHNKLPENTICQSMYKEELYLLCRNTKWRSIGKRKGIEFSLITSHNTSLKLLTTVKNTLDTEISY